MTKQQRTYEIEISAHTLALPKLPEPLAGRRIVHLTDFHCGCGNTSHLLMEAVRRANELAPDIVALTGDFVDHYARDAPLIAEILAPLRAPLGVYGVLGNHDHRGAADRLLEMLPQAGVTVLNNCAHEVMPRFWVAGVDELREGDPDLPGTLAQAPPDAACVLLAHHPETLNLLPPDRPFAVLAGHTHGAQIVLTFPTPATICRSHLGTRYVHGWYGRGLSRMYVNRGLGVTGSWPLNRRFHCPSEIALFELARSTDGNVGGVQISAESQEDNAASSEK